MTLAMLNVNIIIKDYFQSILIQAEILELPSVQDMIELELVHPQLQVHTSCSVHSPLNVFTLPLFQLNTLSVNPMGPWDGGDSINISINFNHMVTHNIHCSREGCTHPITGWCWICCL